MRDQSNAASEQLLQSCSVLGCSSTSVRANFTHEKLQRALIKAPETSSLVEFEPTMRRNNGSYAMKYEKEENNVMQLAG